MWHLPPGMKRRNPGTKKIALETPVSTDRFVKDTSKYLSVQQQYIKGIFNNSRPAKNYIKD